MALLNVGDQAPAFAGATQSGTVSLKALAGKHVVLYFYPKDDTPGCTKEACGFRDGIAALKAKNAVVIGVSADSAASHAKFAAKYSLPFDLLADPDKTVINAYGAWGEKVRYGQKSLGILRITYVIGPDAKIKAVFPKVSPETHAEDILKVL